MIYNYGMIVYLIISIFLIFTTFFITRKIYIHKIKESFLIIDSLTLIDEETGLQNRTFFDKTYILEYHRARRINHPIAILYIDTNNIIGLSPIILNSLKRDTDFISRYNNEHLIAILYDTDSNGADQVINRILGQLTDNINVNIGVYVGIPDNHTSSQKLLNESYKAMLKAKNSPMVNSIEFSLNSI